MQSTVLNSEARQPGAATPGADLLTHIANIRAPLHILRNAAGDLVTALDLDGARSADRLATLPALYPEWLGDRSFNAAHGVRFPYVAGAMARGIASTSLVIAMARAGMLAFFGAGGLDLAEIASALDTIRAALPEDAPWGANLIHSPHAPGLEDATVELFLAKGVRRVSASAFMRLTPAVVHYAFHGVHVGAAGEVVRPNRVLAKISRPEVAEQFMVPPPTKLIEALVAAGKLTASEAGLAATLPVAEEITVEADSGGHTDNRPLPALLPTIAALRDELVRRHGYTRPLHIGAAGGLGTPGAVAAAFAMGAAYVVTGSINQASVEAGISAAAKEMLAGAGIADVVMAPSPDMFELGIKVQVLKRGTLFAGRAQQLYAVYTQYNEWATVPEPTRAKIEREILRRSYAEVWEETEAFWRARAPAVADEGARDPHHQMALVFRWYVGLASAWAIRGDADRQLDYQIWCGPAQGAFNAWVRGTFLEPLANRSVVQIARNLLEGAAVITRAHQLRSAGVDVPRVAFDFHPTPLG